MLLGKVWRNVVVGRNGYGFELLRELCCSYGCSLIGLYEFRCVWCYEGKGENEGGFLGEVYGVYVF